MKPELVKNANSNLLQAKTFQEWESERSQHAMFKSMMNYLHRVEAILFFVAASRNADLTLHLVAGENLNKMFFAMDRIRYKRLWPRYIADMHALRTSHPHTWGELEAGNISVTKKEIPFVSIGADHACEHLNKLMKVHFGLIGISKNANARQRFFLAGPELSRLSDEFKSQFGIDTADTGEHHGLGRSVVRQEHTAVDKIKEAILCHGNPFAVEGDKTYNLINHAYVPDAYVSQILNIDDTGQKLYEDFVAQRLVGDVSIWAPIKKANHKMYMSGNKTQTIKLHNKTIDLRETKNLYGRLMVLTKSSRDINQKEAIGNYEFTLTPTPLFAPNGLVLPCMDKAKLINLLEELPNAQVLPQEHQMLPQEDHVQLQEDQVLPQERLVVQHETNVLSAEGQVLPVQVVTTDAAHLIDEPELNSSRKIAVVDGMVIVRKLKKTSAIQTVKDLSQSFFGKLINLTREYDEILVVFDTYKSDSLKVTTRDRRLQGTNPVQYQIRDDTSIKHITILRFLSHYQTKADLAQYLAEKTLEYNKNSPKVFIVSASGCTKGNINGCTGNNNHEEADTLMIHQAVLASQRNDTHLTFFSLDTDVLVLVLANYHHLLKNTYVSMVSGVIKILPIWTELGLEKAKALPAFHAFSGSDNTGRFARIGKATWFKLYMKADATVVKAFKTIQQIGDVSEEIMTTLESFVCAAYCPRGVNVERIPELRWYLFCKHMAESDRLPPTFGAFQQHLLRVHVETTVWGQASVADQVMIDPLKNGFFKDSNGQFKPTTTDVLPAPKAVMEMVRCQCKINCVSQRCSCKAKELPCTELCMCSDLCDNDEDAHMERTHDTDEDSDIEL